MRFAFRLLAALVTVIACAGAQSGPHIGYVFPAGGQIGKTVDVEIGGQSLRNVQDITVSGVGIHATIVRYWRPLNGKEFQTLANRIQEQRAKPTDAETARRLGRLTTDEQTRAFAQAAGLAEDEIASFIAYLNERTNPKAQLNGQIAEKVYARIEILPSCDPGDHEIRLRMPKNLSNPLKFKVDLAPNVLEAETKGSAPQAIDASVPFVVNGQIVPGDVDRFTFAAQKGRRLVLQLYARDLMPYLADAVPGWFQGLVAVFDPLGKELASADHDGFRQDPALSFVPPVDGRYTVVVRDALYRGRQDFVYRLRVAPGSLVKAMQDRGSQSASGVLDLAKPAWLSGTITCAGQVDRYRFNGLRGQTIVAEIVARRTGSSLDSTLQVLDPAGKSIAFNDDSPNKSEGLETHHADSFIEFVLPKDGVYTVLVRDAVRGVGPYRLRLGPPVPSFDLRVVPSGMIVRPGSATVFSVTVLRKDGYEGPIAFRTIGSAFQISGWVPAGADTARLTLVSPADWDGSPVPMVAEGIATIGGHEVRRPLVPADEMMQAFAYTHLVPALRWCIAGSGGPLRVAMPTLLGPQKLSLSRPTAIRLEFERADGMRQLRVHLIGSDAPGTVVSAKVDERALAVEIRLDPSKAKVGQCGNLLMNASTPKTPTGWLLPAIPYEVVP